MNVLQSGAPGGDSTELSSSGAAPLTIEGFRPVMRCMERGQPIGG